MEPGPKGRLVKTTPPWGQPIAIAWTERAGEIGGPFEGLVVHESDAETEQQLAAAPRVVRQALDLQQRQVYVRARQADGCVTDTWSFFDAAGRLTRQAESSFEDPFYEEPVARHETRYTYDAAGHRVMTEVFRVVGVDGGQLEPWSRTLHLTTGCQ